MEQGISIEQSASVQVIRKQSEVTKKILEEIPLTSELIVSSEGVATVKREISNEESA